MAAVSRLKLNYNPQPTTHNPQPPPALPAVSPCCRSQTGGHQLGGQVQPTTWYSVSGKGMLVCEYFMRLPAGRQESTNGMRLPASGWNAANELDIWEIKPKAWYLVFSILSTVDSRLKSKA